MGSTQTQGNQEYLLEMIGICKSFPGVKALDNAQISKSVRIPSIR